MKAQSSQMMIGAARMRPPTTHTLRLTMNGSAGLNVVILVADSGRFGTWRSGYSSTSNMKLLKSAATSTPTVSGDEADEEALAQLVEVLEQRQTVFGGERPRGQAPVAAPPAGDAGGDRVALRRRLGGGRGRLGRLGRRLRSAGLGRGRRRHVGERRLPA